MKTNKLKLMLFVGLFLIHSHCFAADSLSTDSFDDKVKNDSASESVDVVSQTPETTEQFSSRNDDDTRVFLPNREMYRPLSLPKNRWKLDVGLTLIPGMKGDRFYLNYDMDLSGFQIPYIQLGEMAEFHFVTPMLKYYLLKNTALRNNRIYLEGLNFLLWTGLAGMSYNTKLGFSMSWGLGYQLKTILASDKWLSHSGNGWITSKLGWGIKEKIQIGIQISDNFSIASGIETSIYEFRAYYPGFSSFDKYLGYSLTIPFDLKMNFNRTKGMVIRIGFDYQGNTFNSNDGKNFWGIPLGFQYNWYW